MKSRLQAIEQELKELKSLDLSKETPEIKTLFDDYTNYLSNFSERSAESEWEEFEATQANKILYMNALNFMKNNLSQKITAKIDELKFVEEKKSDLRQEDSMAALHKDFRKLEFQIKFQFDYKKMADPKNFIEFKKEVRQIQQKHFNNFHQSWLEQKKESDKEQNENVKKIAKDISNPIFKKMLEQFASEKILWKKLDKAIEIYQTCQGIMGSNLTQNTLKATKIIAFGFIKQVLKSNDINVIHERINERLHMRKQNKHFIPGTHRPPLTRLPNLTSTQNPVAWRWRNVGDLALGQKRGRVAKLDATAKELDLKNDMKPLSIEERASHQIVLRNGKFCSIKHNENKDFFQEIDTSKSLSHGKTGYVAYVMNTRGEIFFFNHYDAYDRISHGSFVEEENVIAAGEMKIQDGKLMEITNYSGHFKPTEAHIFNILSYLDQQGVDLGPVKLLTFNEQDKVYVESKAQEFLQAGQKNYGTSQHFWRFNKPNQKMETKQENPYDVEVGTAIVSYKPPNK